MLVLFVVMAVLVMMSVLIILMKVMMFIVMSVFMLVSMMVVLMRMGVRVCDATRMRMLVAMLMREVDVKFNPFDGRFVSAGNM